MDAAQLLRERLADLAPSILDIKDDGAAHRGHQAANGGGHFSVVIVSETFSGTPRLARQRSVLKRVADLIPFPIHALSISALAPEEFRSSIPTTPAQGSHS